VESHCFGLKNITDDERRAEDLASIEAITAALVHEIRNPLVAIKTFFQLLPTRYQDAEFRETFARTASRELRRIDALLACVGAAPMGISLPMKLVHVADPIRHTLELLRPQLDERGVLAQLIAEDASCPILGNLTQLEQLYLNLCLNALDAMTHGGELTIRIGHRGHGSERTLLSEISDTGPGIPEAVLAHIFDPFVTTKTRGSGLGLAVCRSIARAHRAHLSAHNNVETPGSTFSVEFPMPVAEQVPAAGEG